jgi:hypothetical protein
MREKITEILNRHQKVSQLFAFDDIPPHKLQRAQRKYASVGDEQVIMLYTSSRFNPGATGFLLTPTRLFYNSMFGRGAADLRDITNMRFSMSGMPEYSIKVRTKTGSFQIAVRNDHPPNSGRFTMSILVHSILALVGRPLERAELPAQESAHEIRLVECRGCAARYVGCSAVCEYCGCPV